MLRYHLQMALKSIRRDPWLSAIVVGTIALGIGISMTTMTIYYLSSRDPIPSKSDRIHTVRLDNWPAEEAVNDEDDPPFDITYPDAVGLYRHAGALRQAAGYNVDFIVHPESPDLRPYRADGRLTHPDFFPMFDVGFAHGGPWTQEHEQERAFVTVLSSAANEKLFGGADSVGRTVRLDEWTFTIVGVLRAWDPRPKFYDLNGGTWEPIEGFFVPFGLTPVLEASKGSGSTACFAEVEGATFQAFLDSECVWVQYWAELESPEAVGAYRDHLQNYVAQQRELGRFPKDDVVLTQGVMELLEDYGVVGDDAAILMGLAFMFLAVCLVNVVGLLLDKFLLRPKELAIRRALGARRKTILRQRLVEVALLGLAGAAVGLLLTAGALKLLRGLAPEELTHLDPTLILIAVGLSVGSALVAGLYPAWRGSRIPPARYLRT